MRIIPGCTFTIDMKEKISYLIDSLHLMPHPEGGFYKESYRSPWLVPGPALPPGFSGERNLSTAIYFLLRQGDYSAFHRIRSDECWHFYEGGTLLVHVIHPVGRYEVIRLGRNFKSGEVFQHVVPAGAWFASEPAGETEFSLVGCTVSPGFDFLDFEMAEEEELLQQFPEHGGLIRRLCRPS